MKWLLLRGLTREKRHWGSFLPKFKNAFGENNVFCLDHVGVGSEAGRAPVKSISRMTDDLRSRWLELKKDHSTEKDSWGIVSLSMGSMVSLDWCARFAEDFAFQVVMNASSARDSAPWRRLLPHNLKIFAEMAKLQEDSLRERRVLDMCTNLLSGEQKDSYAAEWSKFALPKQQLQRVAVSQLIAAATFLRPSKMPVRSLALVSVADRLVDPSCTIAIAQALGLALEMHPSAGHELALDDPDWVIKTIQSFFTDSVVETAL